MPAVEYRRDPLIIGGLGGSGTRVLSWIARNGGLFMGSHVDRHEDAQPFSQFYRHFAPRFLALGRRFPPQERAQVDAFVDERLALHLTDLPHPQHPWGIKNPRSILLLPYWHERFPDMRFIHVIRDGLDMAYSDNRVQLRRFGQLVLGDQETELSEARAIRYWDRVNGLTADYGEGEMRERYLRVRLEDLCDRPHAVVQGIYDFLEVEADDSRVTAAADKVAPPATLGRWREQPAEANARLAQLARAGLERFGYAGDHLDLELR